MPLFGGQIGIVGRAQGECGIVRESDVTAIVARDYAWLHAGCVKLWGRVDMRQKADGGPVSIARNGGKHSAVIGQLHIASTEILKLLLEQVQQVVLNGRAGGRVRCFLALGVNASITN